MPTNGIAPEDQDSDSDESYFPRLMCTMWGVPFDQKAIDWYNDCIDQANAQGKEAEPCQPTDNK